jgi:hypothetical protein
LAGILAIIAFMAIISMIVSASGKYDSARPEITGAKTTVLLALATFSLAMTEIALILNE